MRCVRPVREFWFRENPDLMKRVRDKTGRWPAILGVDYAGWSVVTNAHTRGLMNHTCVVNREDLPKGITSQPHCSP